VVNRKRSTRSADGETEEIKKGEVRPGVVDPCRVTYMPLEPANVYGGVMYEPVLLAVTYQSLHLGRNSGSGPTACQNGENKSGWL
jgi:hypothetical protein